MPILPIYTYDHPVLRQTATPVSTFDAELVKFVDSMMQTMHNADGVGLAANQVGNDRAITTIDISEITDDKTGKLFSMPPLVLINPVIEAYSDATVEFEEGCLSLPQYRENVTRPASIQVRFTDVNMHEQRMEAEGFLARVIQHEIDHLHGTYFFERLSAVKKAMGFQKLRRIQLGQVETSYPLYHPKAAPQKATLKKLAHKKYAGKK